MKIPIFLLTAEAKGLKKLKSVGSQSRVRVALSQTLLTPSSPLFQTFPLFKMSVSLFTVIDNALNMFNDTDYSFESEYVVLEKLMCKMCEPENIARFQTSDVGDTLVTMISNRLHRLACSGPEPNDTFVKAMNKFMYNYYHRQPDGEIIWRCAK